VEGELNSEPAERAERGCKTTDYHMPYVNPQHGWCDVPVFSGSSLAEQVLIDGPAIVEETTDTILVGARNRSPVNKAGNYIIELQ